MSYPHWHRRHIYGIAFLWMACSSFAFHSSTLWRLEAHHCSERCHKPKLFTTSSASTALHAQKSAYSPDNRLPDNSVQYVLSKNGFGQRLVTLSNVSTQPMPCELYENGSWKLCLIVGIKAADDAKKPPRLQVEMLGDDWEEKVVDIGKIRIYFYLAHTTDTP